jgi:cation:H+ antiporter
LENGFLFKEIKRKEQALQCNMLFQFELFIFSGFLLLWSANWLVGSITQIAKYLRWKEFVIAFFVMAIVASFPNLFVGVTAALQGVPELSFGDIVGNSVVDLTLVVALAVLFGQSLRGEGPLVQKSTIITIAVALLPLLLILDKQLGRGDGIVLLLVFLFYSLWLFSKRKEYTHVFNHADPTLTAQPLTRFRTFLGSIFKIIVGILLLLASAQGVVHSVLFFAAEFHLPIATLGILILGLGSALPEIYFTIAAAKKGNSRVILGNLMGSIIVMATLVLGIVALIQPIQIEDFSPFALARFFLIISAFFFLIFLRTERAITKKEGVFLLFLYIAFVAGEIILNTNNFAQ